MTITMPQRIALSSARGSLLKRLSQGRMGAGAASGPLLDPNHLAAVRELPCLKCGLEPCGEAHHVRLSSGSHGKTAAMARKPDDRWTAPVCGACHRSDPDSLHRVGEATFWNALGINPLLICVRLYGASPDIVKMRAIVLYAIAERGS